MAVWSIIKKSKLEGLTRIDPEFYEPRFLDNKSLFEKINCIELLKNIASITTGPAYSSEEFSIENQIPIAKIGDVTNKREPELWDRLSDSEFRKFGNKGVENDSILLTMTGDPPDIGKCIYLENENFDLLAYNQRVCKIRAKKGKISNQFLYTYLSTEKVRIQTERVGLGIRQRNVSINDIKNIKVAILKNAYIGITDIINEYIKTKQESRSLYSQAEQILLEELRLKDLDLKNDLFCTTTLKEVKDNNRMDTEYYIPKYEKLMEHIFNFEHIPLGKLAKFRKGVEPGSDKYFKAGKPFLRVSNLSKFEIINNNQKYLENNLYMQLKKSYEPKKGEILLSKDATPGVAYVLKESIEGIISSGILRLEVASSIKNEYLALVINSQVGQMQMKRDSGGSIINHWKIDQIKNLEIPLLTHDTQKKIENLCCESFLKRKKAKQLLEQAKHKVEEMVEKEAEVK
jgi:restriction endonuclease S subunit